MGQQVKDVPPAPLRGHLDRRLDADVRQRVDSAVLTDRGGRRRCGLDGRHLSGPPAAPRLRLGVGEMLGWSGSRCGPRHARGGRPRLFVTRTGSVGLRCAHHAVGVPRRPSRAGRRHLGGGFRRPWRRGLRGLGLRGRGLRGGRRDGHRRRRVLLAFRPGRHGCRGTGQDVFALHDQCVLFDRLPGIGEKPVIVGRHGYLSVG